MTDEPERRVYPHREMRLEWQELGARRHGRNFTPPKGYKHWHRYAPDVGADYGQFDGRTDFFDRGVDAPALDFRVGRVDRIKRAPVAVFQHFPNTTSPTEPARSLLLNLSTLAADCGISHVTAREWMTVLEASYIVHLLRPHHQNFGKRLVKMPKLYFLDTGLMAYLLGIRDPGTLATHASRGALFETLVVSEWVKRQFNAGQVADLYFWRDSAGYEVDLLIPQGNRFMPVEIKSGATYSSDWSTALRKLSALFGDAALPPGIVYGGDGQYERDGCRVAGWQALAHSS